MNEIFVVAYPKSGITWLVRLLSDLLDSPQQDIEDGPIIGVWGERCDGVYVIRKRHDNYSPVYRGKNVVVLVRDPRDVVVSSYHYLCYRDIDEAIKDVTPAYDKWLNSWIDRCTVQTQYRWLVNQPEAELYRIATTVTGKARDMSKVALAVRRHSFEAMKKEMHDDHFMRRGIVGDWRNHLTASQCEDIRKHLGGIMVEFGYDISGE